MTTLLNKYQNFIALYFKLNPEIIKELFEFPESEEVISDAIIADNWQFDDAAYLTGNKEKDKEFLIDELKHIRKEYGQHISIYHRLALLNDKYCGQVVYLILESDLGELHVGEYVGD